MGHGIGIDVGAEAVKVVEVRASAAAVEVLHAECVPRSALGVDAADTSAVARAAAARALARGVRRGTAVVGIADSDTVLRYLAVPPAPAWKLHQLLDDEVGQATGEGPRAFARDMQPLALPRRSPEELLLLVAMARHAVLEERMAACAAGGLAVEYACPEAVGLFHTIARCVETTPSEVVALLDVGATKTDVVLVRGGALVFLGSVLPGGREFTRAIAEALGVSLAHGEEMKRRRGAVLSGGEIARHTGEEARFYEALAAVAEHLARSVQSALMSARTQTALTGLEVGRFYLSGAGAGLRGLREHLAEGLGRPVELLDVGAGVAGAESVRESPSPYGVALGLAMMAAGQDAFALRLVPERVAQRRRFRRKGIFAWAAAALLLLALGASVLGTVHGWLSARRQLAAVRAALEQAEKEQASLDETRRQIDGRYRKYRLLADRVRAKRSRPASTRPAARSTAATASTACWPTGSAPTPSCSARSTRSASRRRPPFASSRCASPQEPPPMLRVGPPSCSPPSQRRTVLGTPARSSRRGGAPVRARWLRQSRLGTPRRDRVEFRLAFTPAESLIEEGTDDAGRGG